MQHFLYMSPRTKLGLASLAIGRFLSTPSIDRLAVPFVLKGLFSWCRPLCILSIGTWTSGRNGVSGLE